MSGIETMDTDDDRDELKMDSSRRKVHEKRENKIEETDESSSRVKIMSDEKYQRISWGEIKHIQNLIERCIQTYMSQAEIIAALQREANIQPGFTCLVWQKLEEQNPRFFYLYSVMLQLRNQIVAYNHLVKSQDEVEKTLRIGQEIPGPVSSKAIDLSVLSAGFSPDITTE